MKMLTILGGLMLADNHGGIMGMEITTIKKIVIIISMIVGLNIVIIIMLMFKATLIMINMTILFLITMTMILDNENNRA